MQIVKVAVGNKEEAFIEKKFTRNINFILSNENNRGKTIVFQSMMYAIGNAANFPTGFMPDQYYHFCEFINENINYQILRNKKVFVIKTNETITYCYSEDEFRNWFDNNIYKLPKFRNDNGLTKTDLPLFYELFFLPQDKRNTSNIINRGYRNKTDFISLVNSILYPENEDIDYELINTLKKKVKKLENEISNEIKKNDFIKDKKEIAVSVFSSVDKIEAERIENEMEELNKNISDISSKIRREENRKMKLISLLSELTSVNKMLEEGTLKCAECGSDKIIFDLNDTKFDLSNIYVRNQIIASIREKIEQKSQNVDDLANSKYKLKQKLEEILITQSQDITDYLIYKREIEKTKDTNKLIDEKKQEIDEIKKQIKEIENKELKRNDELKKLFENLLYQMRLIVQKLDPNSAFFIDNLFTKNNENFSGSEEQVFYFAKIYILVTLLKLPFPIIIDSFRDGELSSNKEQIMLEEFNKLENQIIISATLKNEEFVSKYKKYSKINIMDYSNFKDCKLLSESYVDEFLKIVSELGVKIN